VVTYCTVDWVDVELAYRWGGGDLLDFMKIRKISQKNVFGSTDLVNRGL
jgi:hypothetical protein